MVECPVVERVGVVLPDVGADCPVDILATRTNRIGTGHLHAERQARGSGRADKNVPDLHEVRPDPWVMPC